MPYCCTKHQIKKHYPVNNKKQNAFHAFHSQKNAPYYSILSTVCKVKDNRFSVIASEKTLSIFHNY